MLRRAGGPRHLATVLFTDIVGSTERAAELGDRRWRQLIGDHHAILRRALRRHGGHEVDTAGDGFFATFDSPAAAVDCARTAVEEVEARLRLHIRAAVHTGEVERVGRKVGGIAVHIAARVLALAGPGEVLVTGTVRDLVSGSGLRFSDRGTHQLKGVPEPWHLYSLEVEAPSPSGDVVDVLEPSARASRERGPIALAAAGALVAVAALMAAAYVLVLARPGATAAPSQFVGANGAIAIATDGSIVGGQTVGVNPTAVVAGGGWIWVANLDSKTVTRLDPTGGPPLTIGNRATALAYEPDANRLWVLDGLAGRLSAVDGRNGQVLDSFGQSGRGIAVGGGAVWIADEVRESVVVIDALSRQVTATVELPPGSAPVAVAVSGESAWIAASGSGNVERLDVQTRSRVGSGTSLAGSPSDIAVGQAVWVASAATDSLIRLDAADGRVGRTYADICDEPGGLAVAADTAWLACRRDGSLLRVGPDDAVETIDVGFVPTDVAFDGERVWVTLASD